jgi:hypothetical protein
MERSAVGTPRCRLHASWPRSARSRGHIRGLPTAPFFVDRCRNAVHPGELVEGLAGDLAPPVRRHPRPGDRRSLAQPAGAMRSLTVNPSAMSWRSLIGQVGYAGTHASMNRCRTPRKAPKDKRLRAAKARPVERRCAEARTKASGLSRPAPLFVQFLVQTLHRKVFYVGERTCAATVMSGRL